MGIKEEAATHFRQLQAQIVESLETFEANIKFESHPWKRPGGGGGDSRILAFGDVFEKAGVNVSEVYGELPELIQKKFGSQSKDFYATGLSLVIHPKNPHVPTVHANWRYFEQSDRAWFGGGADLTPYTFVPEEFAHFHSALREPCEAHRQGAYQEFKKNCDDYFYLPHREEHRGIGGIFFDYLNTDLEQDFKFIKESGHSFIPAYVPIIERQYKKTPTERMRQFQLLRRGRYVEFNLVYDRGTKFGLETKGNIESILMSLPPLCGFEFKPDLEVEESEAELMKVIRRSREWVSKWSHQT